MNPTILARYLSCGVLAWCWSAAINVMAADSISAAEPIEAFLNQHCVRCHGPKQEEGFFPKFTAKQDLFP